MYLDRKVLEKEKLKNCNLINPIFKSDIDKYILFFLDRLERKDPKLKSLICQYRDFDEKRLFFYVNRVNDYIHDRVYLKQFFKSIGVKYLKSQLSLENLKSISNVFLETLEIYSIARGKLVDPQLLSQLYSIIFDAILEGAKEEYSLWHKNIENTFTCVSRMKIEVIIQRSLALSYDNEEIVSQRLMQKNTYFQKAIEKIGKQKTKELIAVTIDTVKKKSKLGVN